MFVIICHRFMFNFHWNFLVKTRKSRKQVYAKLRSDIPEDIPRNSRVKVKHIFSSSFIARVTTAIVTVTKRTFPVTADIATMRFLSEGRHRAFRYFTSIGSRLSPLEATLYLSQRIRIRGLPPLSSATNISVEDSVSRAIVGPIFNLGDIRDVTLRCPLKRSCALNL